MRIFVVDKFPIWSLPMDSGVEEVYGYHNWPMDKVVCRDNVNSKSNFTQYYSRLSLTMFTQWQGTVAVVSGPLMAANFELAIEITGRGGHASQPHYVVDPVVCSGTTYSIETRDNVCVIHTIFLLNWQWWLLASVILALQSIVSRNIPSKETAVISVTMVHGGEATNVIPDTVHLNGSIRSVSISL